MMEKDPSRVAIVTGSSRGIGYATVKRLCRKFDGHVYLTSHKTVQGRCALQLLNHEGLYPQFHHLDVTNAKSRLRFTDYLKGRYGGIDVLVNNAGRAYPVNSTTPFIHQANNTLNVNFYGMLYLCQLLFPLLRPHARVVNLSSSKGLLHHLPSGTLRRQFGSSLLLLPDILVLLNKYKVLVANGRHRSYGWGENAYVVSKIAVNALTFVQNRTLPSDMDIIVNCVHPGNVNTSMLNFRGRISPDEAAKTIVWLATLPVNTVSPKGEFVWHDRNVVDWKAEPPGY